MTEEIAKKKGLGLLGWILIGCAGILVGGAALLTVAGIWGAKKLQQFSEDPAAISAELFVKVNPELELVESDRDAGTITVKNKSDGKIYTFDYEEIQDGHFSIESDEGTVDFDASAAKDGGAVRIQTADGKASIGGTDDVMTIETDEGTAVFGKGSQEDLPDWLPLLKGEITGAYRSETPQQIAGGIGLERTGGGSILKDYRALLEREDFTILSYTEAGDGGMIQATAAEGRRTVIVVTEGSTKAMIQYSEKRGS